MIVKLAVKFLIATSRDDSCSNMQIYSKEGYIHSTQYKAGFKMESPGGNDHRRRENRTICSTFGAAAEMTAGSCMT